MALQKTKQPSALQDLARMGMGGVLALAGISHLTFARDEFQAQVPESLPFDEDFVVVASGIVEISLGTAFALWKEKRIPLGWLMAAFFIAVFPGNISQYLTRTDAFGLDTDKKRFGRLFLQPVLVGVALWASGAWAERNKGLKG